jgi:sterol desaturase/sphingolipid hydroxylase (fatty acid hydroxylase superfamily)
MPDLLTKRPEILPVLLALALVEWLWRTKFARKSYDLRASFASVGVAVGGAITKPLTFGVVAAAFAAAHQIAPVKLPIDDPRVWIGGFFAVELAYYWFHRWSHTINWLRTK